MKLKKVLKNKIFIFTLFMFVCGIVGVYAVTYFPSNDVTYDNKESGLTSTNVQDAIDEIYNTCSKGTPQTSEQIKENVVTTGDGLYKDEYEDGRYFYKGADPNNYIIFDDEMWRIMSLEADGTIKIVSNLLQFRYSWDISPAWNKSESNDWNKPSSLNTLLNGIYYNRLNTNSKNKIVSHNWNVGMITGWSTDISGQIKEENSKTWKGNIALPTVSEFIRANSNMSQCGNFYSHNRYDTICPKTNWMVLKNYTDFWWTLSGRKDDYT